MAYCCPVRFLHKPLPYKNADPAALTRPPATFFQRARGEEGSLSPWERVGVRAKPALQFLNRTTLLMAEKKRRRAGTIFL